MVYLFIVISAIALILFFKLLKRFAPSQYFIISDIFGEGLNYKVILIRFATIFVHNILVLLIMEHFTSYEHSLSFIVFSNFLASFLIIWPIIYIPERNLLVFPSKKTKLLLYLFYLLFIVFSMATGWFSQYFYELYLYGKDIKSIWEENILPNLLNSLVGTIFVGSVSILLSQKLVINFKKDRSNQNENFK